MTNANICVIGNDGAGKTTLLSAISKYGGDFISYDEIEKRVKSKGNYNVIELKQTINDRDYTFFEFPTHADYEVCINSEDIHFNAVLFVEDCTDVPPEEEMNDALDIKYSDNCIILVFVNKQDLCDDEEMLELVKLQTMTSLEIEENNVFTGSALEAMNEKSQYYVDSVRRLVNTLHCIYY